VQVAAVDQSRDSLDDKKTVWEEISDGQDLIKVGTYETPSRAYVGRFNFRGSEQQKQIGLLSGGERNRVSTNRRTISMYRRCGRLNRRFWSFRGPP
jgi:ATPase subunit of ABC transporter with duplicated ATPase domains